MHHFSPLFSSLQRLCTLTNYQVLYQLALHLYESILYYIVHHPQQSRIYD